jgi:hypothetical protein
MILFGLILNFQISGLFNMVIQLLSDEVEYRDTTPHSSFVDANIGDISQFSSRWDSAHLAKLQADWDSDNAIDENGNSTETEAEKITRLGARPISYSS